jgi:hypothetical protein
MISLGTTVEDGAGAGGWHHSNRGCGSVSSVIVILGFSIYSHAVKFNLLGDLCNEFIARLDHTL